MKKYVIALGTTSEQKAGYLKEILDELNVVATIKTFSVSSGVSDQPITDAETKVGSQNRAEAAYKTCNKCDFAMGVEVGYHPDGVEYDMFCYVTIVTTGSSQTVHKSSHIRLPEYHRNILESKKYLGEHVQEYIDLAGNEADRSIGLAIKTREPIIKEAIQIALENYL